MSRTDIMQALQSECTMSDETALDIIEHRQKVVKRPLTVRSARTISRELAKVPDVEKAVDIWLSHAWITVKADWINKPSRYQEQNNPTPKAGGAPVTFERPKPNAPKPALPHNHFLERFKRGEFSQ